MNTYQTSPNATHFTDEKLFCNICKKQFNRVLETKNNLYCWECFYKKSLLFFNENEEYVLCREINDVLFNDRKEIKKKERQKLTLKLRFTVFKRDAFKCIACGRDGRNSILEVDHVQALTNGGKTILKNLQTLCFDCNRGKGAS